MSANIEDFNIQDIEEITQSLANLMPNGVAYRAKNIPDSKLRSLMKGLMGEGRRCSAQIYSLASKFTPNLTGSYIDIWEKFLGIPDDCFPINLTDEERRANILIKLAYLNLYGEQDYYDLANVLGIELTNIDNSVVGHLDFEYVEKVDNSFPQLFDTNNDPVYGAFLFGQKTLDIFKCLVEKYSPANVAVSFTGITVTFEFDFMTGANILPEQIDFSRVGQATAVDSTGDVLFYGTDIYRFNYDTSGTLLGFLIEDEFTNIVTYSNDLTQWTQNNVTINQDALDSPVYNGSTYEQADSVTKGGNGDDVRIEIDTSVVNNTDYNTKIWLKNIDTNGDSRISFGNDTETLFDWSTKAYTVEDGTPTNLSVTSYKNNWDLLSFDHNATNDSDFNFFVARNGTATNGTTASCYGVQITESLDVISYIPSDSGTATTKNRDIALFDTTGLFGVDVGTILLEHDVATGNPILDDLMDSFGAGKTLLKWNATESKIFSNGALVSTGGVITVGAILNLFYNSTTTTGSFGHLKRIKCYNVEISDADAIIQTT